MKKTPKTLYVPILRLVLCFGQSDGRRRSPSAVGLSNYWLGPQRQKPAKAQADPNSSFPFRRVIRTTSSSGIARRTQRSTEAKNWIKREYAVDGIFHDAKVLSKSYDAVAVSGQSAPTGSSWRSLLGLSPTAGTYESIRLRNT